MGLFSNREVADPVSTKTRFFRFLPHCERFIWIPIYRCVQCRAQIRLLLPLSLKRQRFLSRYAGCWKKSVFFIFNPPILGHLFLYRIFIVVTNHQLDIPVHLKTFGRLTENERQCRNVRDQPFLLPSSSINLVCIPESQDGSELKTFNYQLADVTSRQGKTPMPVWI